ncbi:MAG TPA: hypothetical protein VGQ96_03655 [Candidatus Eremiobacteraceae bacterium]|nr:hypothetical protein [Candidatus Eremiobacteraceae bacterium]
MKDSSDGSGEKSPAAIFRKLRNQVLALSAKDVAGAPLPTGVFGALMEFTAGQTWVSLVAILDGTTSLYFGSGGGIIGAGKSEIVRKANRLFLEVAGQFVSRFAKTESYPTPQPNHMRFYLLTSDGVRASDEIREDAVRQRGNELFGLYAAAQNVITQIRLVQEKQQAK